jgi:hypothetical protein
MSPNDRMNESSLWSICYTPSGVGKGVTSHFAHGFYSHAIILESEFSLILYSPLFSRDMMHAY